MAESVRNEDAGNGGLLVVSAGCGGRCAPFRSAVASAVVSAVASAWIGTVAGALRLRVEARLTCGATSAVVSAMSNASCSGEGGNSLLCRILLPAILVKC